MSTPTADVTFPPLRRDLRVLAWITAASISRAGDVAWYVGLAWTAAHVSGPAGAGLVMGIGTVPRAALALVGGAYADRLDPRRTMIAANLARIAILVVALTFVSIHGSSFGLLIAIALVFGLVDAMYDPASGTMPRQLVSPDDLGSVAAMFQLGGRLAGLIGAPIGGVLVATGGISAVMIADAVSFGVIAIVLATLVRPRVKLERSSGTSIRADLADGLRYLSRKPNVRTMVIALSGLNLFVSPVIAVGLVLRVKEASWGATSLGLFEATLGVGAAAGAVAAMRWKPARPARIGLLVLLGQAAACAAVGFAPRIGVYAAMLVIGVTAGLASAFLSGAFQRMVDAAYLGRTGSLVGIADSAGMPLAMTGFGALASAATVATACAVAGGGFATTVGWSAFRPGIDDTSEDAGEEAGSERSTRPADPLEQVTETSTDSASAPR